MKNFENTVFNKITNKKVKTAKADIDDIELSFNFLATYDKAARVEHLSENQHRITFSRSHLAFTFSTLFQQENSEVPISFSEDYLDFQPDSDVIKKSKFPLWVVKLVKPGVVMVEKMCTA